MPIFLIMMLLILTEIALFVVVGGRIGLWPVLGLTLISVLAGLAVLRLQGARGAALARGGLNEVSAGSFLAQGAFALLAGMLLLLPGFLTDLTGLLLLLPPLQRLLMRAIAARIDAQPSPGRGAARGQAEIIEGSFSVDDETDDETDGATRPEDGAKRCLRPAVPEKRDNGTQGGDRGH